VARPRDPAYAPACQKHHRVYPRRQAAAVPEGETTMRMFLSAALLLFVSVALAACSSCPGCG